MSTITIYHNPDCGTSRNTLGLIRNTGAEPAVIEYLKTPPSREAMADLIQSAGLTVRQALREKGTPFLELGLEDPSSEEHTSDLQSLMRISYAVFCLKKNKRLNDL